MTWCPESESIASVSSIALAALMVEMTYINSLIGIESMLFVFPLP
jgi:hypothetical protein